MDEYILLDPITRWVIIALITFLAVVALVQNLLLQSIDKENRRLEAELSGSESENVRLSDKLNSVRYKRNFKLPEVDDV